MQVSSPTARTRLGQQLFDLFRRLTLDPEADHLRAVDELDLTLSPVLVGGDGARIVAAAAPTFDRYDLVHLATEDGYLYGRWVRR